MSADFRTMAGRLGYRPDIGAIVGALLVLAAFGAVDPNGWWSFFTIENVTQYTAIVGFLVLGQTLVIMTGEIEAIFATPFGNRLLATGGSEASAVSQGVDTLRLKFIVFLVAGAPAAFAGVLEASKIGFADGSFGRLRELDAIAARREGVKLPDAPEAHAPPGRGRSVNEAPTPKPPFEMNCRAPIFNAA